MSNLVRPRLNYGSSHNRLHSNALWYDCPFIQGGDAQDGVYWFDDFLYFQEPTTGEVNGPYRALDTGDSTLTLSAATPTGALALLVTTDNEDCGIQLGDTGSGG